MARSLVRASHPQLPQHARPHEYPRSDPHRRRASPDPGREARTFPRRPRQKANRDVVPFTEYPYPPQPARVAQRRLRRYASTRFPMCSTNGCATFMTVDTGGATAACPICGEHAAHQAPTALTPGRPARPAAESRTTCHHVRVSPIHRDPDGEPSRSLPPTSGWSNPDPRGTGARRARCVGGARSKARPGREPLRRRDGPRLHDAPGTPGATALIDGRARMCVQLLERRTSTIARGTPPLPRPPVRPCAPRSARAHDVVRAHAAAVERLNAEAPTDRQHRRRLDLQDELARLDRAFDHDRRQPLDLLAP